MDEEECGEEEEGEEKDEEDIVGIGRFGNLSDHLLVDSFCVYGK